MVWNQNTSSLDEKRALHTNQYVAGERIAVGYADGTIRVLNLKAENILATIPSNQGHLSIVTAIDCHKDNNLLISASIDGKTILSTSHNGKVKEFLQISFYI